jgi:tetratricopeptide (TPR) repeat protein
MSSWADGLQDKLTNNPTTGRSRTTISAVFAIVLAILTASPVSADTFSAAAYGLSLLTGARVTRVQTNPARNQAIKLYNKAAQLLRQGRASDAIPKFQQVLQIDPSLECTYGALGCALVETGDDANAIGILDQATRLDRRNGGYWFELAVCAQHLHRYRDSYYAYKHFLALEPNGQGADHARISIQIYEHTYMASPQTIAEDRGTNYLADADVRNHALNRWSKEQMPLKVFIRDGSGVPGYEPAFGGVLRDAFNAWAACTSGLLQFSFVNDENSADIVCFWTANKADLDIGCGGRELGVTRVQSFNTGCMKHAEIRLLTAVGEGVKNEQEALARAKSVDLHEIGHAIGLQHSTETYDTMAPVAPPIGLEFPLTMRDRNTVLALYNLNTSALGSSAGNVPVAMSAPAIRSAESSEDVCERLNSEASEANKQQQFKLAMDKLEQAHKIAPQNQTISRNLGLVYSNVAAQLGQEGNSIEAKAMYELSLKLLSETNDKDNYQSVLQDYNQWIASSR